MEQRSSSSSVMNELGGFVEITLVLSKMKTIPKLEAIVDLLHEECD